MKLKSLILGSVAAAGLSTAGFAADLGVLTSLDVCDSLGISGLTISSSDNCLAISGKVTYEFNWGDFNGTAPGYGFFDLIDNDEVVVGADTFDKDWRSDVDMWLKFVGTAASDFGPASATIKIDVAGGAHEVNNAGFGLTPAAADAGVLLDEAFVSVGDTTTLMAGLKGSIANMDDDEPFNWLGLFLSEENDDGVDGLYFPETGGHVIQVVSDLGNGIKVKGGLENLDGSSAEAGTLVGVLEYAGEGITAHITGLAGGVLAGNVDEWAVHAGVTGTFDAFKVRGAFAYSAAEVGGFDNSTWNALISGQGTFDMFTVALSGEFGSADVGGVVTNAAGFGGSVGATVTEGVKINLGARWFDFDTSTNDNEIYQVAAQIVAAVTETIELTGEVGVYGTSAPVVDETDFYGKASLAWKPGGQFESSLGAEVHQNGAYKVTFKASKEFK